MMAKCLKRLSSDMGNDEPIRGVQEMRAETKDKGKEP
jgi:hypothetical protein